MESGWQIVVLVLVLSSSMLYSATFYGQNITQRRGVLVEKV